MKRAIIFLLVIFVCLCSQAQKITYGVKAGALLSKLSGESFNNNYKPGYEGGVYANVAITKKISVQAEILFSNFNLAKSAEFDKIYNNKQNTVATTPFSTYHVSIPVLAVYPLYKNLNIVAGPQVSIKTFTNENLFRNSAAAFKPIDLSAVAGLQWKLKGISFYGRYVYGLTSMNNYDNRDSWKRGQASVGLEIPVFK